MNPASIPNNSPTVRCSFQKTRFQTTAQTIPMSYLFDNFASEKHLRVNDNLEPFPNIKKFFKIKKLIQKIITLYKKYIVKKILLLLCSILKNYFKYLVGFKVI